MERWMGKVAIVSGANSGIGAAITRSLVKSGVNVVGLARNLERFEPLKKELKNEKGKLYTIKCDVTNADEILSAVNWVNENLSGADILVNNSGVFELKISLLDISIDQIRNIVDTNLVGAMVLTKEVLNSMKRRNVDGHVIFINSISGKQVYMREYEQMNVYPASKFGLKAYAEVLRNDLLLDKSKIKVSSLYPGLATTNLIPQQVLAFFDNTELLDPEDCANAVIYMLGTPPHMQIPELTMRGIFFKYP